MYKYCYLLRSISKDAKIYVVSHRLSAGVETY